MGQKLSVAKQVLPSWENVKENPREWTILVWAAWLVVKQVKAKFDTLSEDEIEKITVKRAGKMFTKTTEGGKTDLSWFGAVEYWLVTFIRGVECYGMYKYGYKFFRPSSTGMTMWHRFRNLAYAVFCALPVLDVVLPEDWSNPENEAGHNHKDPKFRTPLHLWTVFELYSTFKVLEAIVHPKSKLSQWDVAGLVGVLAIFNGGVGINTSHELLHKRSILDKVLGYALLMNVNYMHWGEEHLTGHHENVATPMDPATSAKNEMFYQFLPKTFIGSWKSAWNLEQKRMKESNEPWYMNRMIAHTVLPFLWASAIAKYTGGGWRVIKLFYLQGFMSALLLEMVNYVEHYGLTREKLENGEYEPVNPTHSWNAPHRLSNTFLYKLQRHSDHHTYASRPYQLLRNFHESPQLPNGYPGMLVMAICPPIYRWIMNPLVDAAKVTPEHYQNESGMFQKDEKWINAERTGKLKTLSFTIPIFLLATYMLRQSELARFAKKAVSA